MTSGGELETQWAGKRCAVSLTYDGTDLSHIETVLPALEEFELQASFYALPVTLLDRASAWQAAANAGHEIGAGPFFDCHDGRGSLPNWTLDSVEEDLRLCRKLLVELFPHQSQFGFAYPGDQADCVHSNYDRRVVSYRTAVEQVFDVARSMVGGLNSTNPDLLWLFAYDVEGMSGDEMVALAEGALGFGAWAIFSFGGVGSGERSVDVRAHRRLLHWIRAHRESVNVGPVGTIARWTASRQEARRSAEPPSLA
ncbi:MAG: hypothetical protein SNJ74_08510 [Fimbriimonadaceae bacterium]